MSRERKKLYKKVKNNCKKLRTIRIIVLYLSQETIKKIEIMEMTVENQKIQRHPRGGYGQYLVTGTVNGIDVSAHSTNSMAFDWFNDDEEMEAHEDAVKYVHNVLINAYENNF